MKEAIDIELTEQVFGLKMMKMLLILDDLVYKMKMRKILLWFTYWKLQKQADEEIFPKKLLDDYGIVPNEKKI